MTSQPPPATGTRTTRRAIVLGALWAAIVFQFGYHMLWRPMHDPGVDYTKHWGAARAIVEGRSPYEGELYLGFNYPLFTGYLFIHLAAFTQRNAEVVWDLGNALFALLGALVAARYMRPSGCAAPPGEPATATRLRLLLSRYWTTAVFLAVANYQPLLHNYLAANIDPLNFLLAVGFAAAVCRRRDGLAGLLLAAITLVKLIPVLLVVPALAAGRRRLLCAYAAALAVYAAHLAVTGMWRTELFLYTDVLPRIGYHFTVISYALHLALARLFHPAALASNTAFQHWCLAVNLVLFAFYAGYCVAWRFAPRRDFLELLAACCPAIVLFTPLLEYHHFVWAAPAMVLQMKAWAEGRLSPGAAVLCAAGWVALTACRVMTDMVLVPWLPFPAFWFMAPAGVWLAVVAAWISLRPGPAQPAHACQLCNLEPHSP